MRCQTMPVKSVERGTIMQEPKKRGRPPKPQIERRRHNQTFRCNDEMLARLKTAADKNQRSLSEEVEQRLSASFTADIFEDYAEAMREEYSALCQLNRLESMCGGRENFEFSWFIGENLAGIRRKFGIKPDTPINDIPADVSRQMMNALIAVLPARFGVFDADEEQEWGTRPGTAGARLLSQPAPKPIPHPKTASGAYSDRMYFRVPRAAGRMASAPPYRYRRPMSS